MKQEQDIANILLLPRKDVVARMVKTMKSSREIGYAKTNGTLAALNDEVEAVVEAVASHILVVDDRIGEDLVSTPVTRREAIEALLPKGFTSQQRLVDQIEMLFCKDDDDGRVSLLFFRKNKIVVLDHLTVPSDDPRSVLLCEYRQRMKGAIKDQAVSCAEEALGIRRDDDEYEGNGTMPFDVEKEAKKRDGNAAAFARVDKALPETGAARRLFDLIRPYRDPSVKYRSHKPMGVDSIDHFLSYCAAHVKPLRQIAMKVIDFKTHDEEVNHKRHRLRRVKDAYLTILRIPVYGRVSNAFESLGEEGLELKHVSIDPTSLIEGRMPPATGNTAIIVETIDPEMIEMLNDASQRGEIPVMSPLVVLFRPIDDRWYAMLTIGSAQIEYVMAFDGIRQEDESPVTKRIVSILANATSDKAAQRTDHDRDDAARAATAPPPLAARVRFRVEDANAAYRAINAWHIGHLNKLGEDVLRSRAVDGSWLIEHLDGQDKSRRWSVRVTSERTDRHVLTLELGADKGRAVIPRMPAVMRRIAAATDTRAIDGALHASAKNVANRVDVENLSRALRDPTRILPIVVVSSQDDQRLVEPDTLNVQTLGAMDVWSIELSAYELLEERIGADMGVRAGETRIYMPGFTPDDSPFEHPTVHLSNSGHKRLSEIVTREINATLWRYPSIYEVQEESDAGTDQDAGESSAKTAKAEPAVGRLPAIPSYGDIKRLASGRTAQVRQVGRQAIAEPDPKSATDERRPIGSEQPAPSTDAQGAEAKLIRSDEPLLPLLQDEAPASSEAAPEPTGGIVEVVEPVQETIEATDVSDEREPHGTHEAEVEGHRGTSAVQQQAADASDDDAEIQEEPTLDLGDVPDRRPASGNQDAGDAVRLQDIETLFELYTKEMGQTQSVMNERIDAAVSRIDSVARLMLIRMGIPEDEIGPHIGPTAEQSRLKEDDARMREHEIEIEEMKDEMRRLRAALEAERHASAARGVETRPYPQHMSEVREWFDATLSGKVHIVSKAWKNMRKSSNEYPAHAVERMCRALELLGGPGLDMHCGDADAKLCWIEGLSALRLDQSYDSTTTSGPMAKNERTLTYQGERMFMNRHLRGTESGHNDRDLLRIYYVHHAETNQIVVGHLPDHLSTAAS